MRVQKTLRVSRIATDREGTVYLVEPGGQVWAVGRLEGMDHSHAVVTAVYRDPNLGPWHELQAWELSNTDAITF